MLCKRNIVFSCFYSPIETITSIKCMKNKNELTNFSLDSFELVSLDRIQFMGDAHWNAVRTVFLTERSSLHRTY